MQPGQPNWNISKCGNNLDQWNVYDDNNNGAYVATVEGAYNARLVVAAPDLLELLQEMLDWTIYKNSIWATKANIVITKIKENT